MFVETIMTRGVIVVEEDAKISHLAGLMQAKRVRHMPVVDATGKLVGILSHRDVQKASPSDITTLSAGEVNYLLSRLTAKDIMHRQVVTCAPDTLVEDAGLLMREKTIGCLPVVEGEKLVGILTGVDLLDFFLDITGCRERSAARVAVRLEEKAGNLYRLLEAMNQLGCTIVSVVTPQTQRDEEQGTRSVIVRYTAENPEAVDRQLADSGYKLISEVLPQVAGPAVGQFA